MEIAIPVVPRSCIEYDEEDEDEDAEEYFINGVSFDSYIEMAVQYAAVKSPSYNC